MPQPFPEEFMQAVFNYVKALTDDPVISVAVLTGNPDEDWLAVALTKSPDMSPDEVSALFVHALIAEYTERRGET